MFTSRRVAFYGAIVCASYLAMLAAMTVLADRPTRVDFMAFYEAGRLAIEGQAAKAYDWAQVRPLQAALMGVDEREVETFLGWVNPPHFLFAVVPFSWMPFGWAWFLWAVATALLMAIAIRSVFPEAATPACILALCAPAVFTCASVGQNGLLTAALMAWTYALMDRRPVLAGVALGLLTYKPQFGLLPPLILAATGRWRVFAAAAVTAIAAMAAALLTFGPATLLGFLDNVALNNDRYLAEANAVLPRIQSVYALVLGITERTDIAWALHLAFAAAVAAIVLRLWLRRPEGPEEARAAAAIAASFLMTPFTWVYDAPSLVVAGAFLWRAGMRQGYLAWERPLIVLACVSTQVIAFTGPHSAIVPASWLVLLALAWRRDRAWRLSQGPSATPS